MYEYRQALMRMRQGDSEREIARSKLMGRSKAARFRELARTQGWLDPERPLPEDAEIAAALGQPKLPVTAQSSIAAYRPLVERWLAQGVSGVEIHTTLKREHGFSGHYSSVRRLIAQIGREQPPEATVRLTFAPGEAAQVDFGAGPQMVDPATGEIRRTWAFVMTLCFSRLSARVYNSPAVRVEFYPGTLAARHGATDVQCSRVVDRECAQRSPRRA